jgi:hypothetical protein
MGIVLKQRRQESPLWWDGKVAEMKINPELKLYG